MSVKSDILGACNVDACDGVKSSAWIKLREFSPNKIQTSSVNVARAYVQSLEGTSGSTRVILNNMTLTVIAVVW